ncbi:hypothetical protein [Methylopila turkensis]|uniref:DUF3108 domain-containing protein n=1 Tax=Methylopila turkensis TaxID=1437816 RepID=A0A9W6JPM4_9HYPH|nr:hypothetical protein [Methylopila turkensis]GLK81017.1 hypothetical protein GCM10008174_27580 [Methylopila turkensis]
MLKIASRAVAAAAVSALCFLSPAYAAPTAVELVFEQPYLAKIDAGAALSYRFERKTDDKGLSPSFEDSVTLKLSNDEKGRKEAVVDMFTGSRARTVGPLGTAGNPVVIALLEQDVREMQKVLGGSPYYIRNRMRDAINDGGVVEAVKVEFDGRSVDGWRVTLKPFTKDVERERFKDFAERSYELIFSDAVPGGLYKLVTVTPKKGAEAPLLVENLTLQGVAAAKADAK